MNELINGRTTEEIKHVAEWACFSCGGLECDECEYRDACTIENRDRAAPDALALIQHLEAQQPKWISVEERLPERYMPVLILVKSMPDNPNSSYICLVGVYDGDYWMKDSGHYYDDIDGEAVCWMPLPNPPKEDE